MVASGLGAQQGTMQLWVFLAPPLIADCLAGLRSLSVARFSESFLLFFASLLLPFFVFRGAMAASRLMTSG